MTDAPIIVRRVRCPRCRSTATEVYRTLGVVQYRRCLYCRAQGIATTFKTVREPAEPNGTLEPLDDQAPERAR